MAVGWHLKQMTEANSEFSVSFTPVNEHIVRQSIENQS